MEVGATGSLLWCFADYHESLHGTPPLVESRHERHFGLVRPDGTLKPHAEALRAFAAARPLAREVAWDDLLDVTPEEYYADPAGNAARLYERYLERRAVA